MIISGNTDPEQIYALIRASANAHVPKSMSVKGLIKSLEVILSGVAFFPTDLIAKHVVSSVGKGEVAFNGHVLMAKEMDVIELLVAG